MNNKKKVFGFLGFSVLTAGLISFVSAPWGSFDLSRGPDNVVRMIIDFFRPLFASILGVGGYEADFFARVLLLIVLYILISISLENVDLFRNKKGVIFIVSAVVAILGARYIAELDVIQAILLPYGVVAISLSVMLPFFVFFFFVHKSMSSGAARRTAWIFFALIFVGLWYTRRADFGALDSNLRMIYTYGIIAIAASIIFDPKIHEYFGIVEAAEFKRGVVKRQIADVEEQLQRLSGVQNPSRTTRDVIQHLEERRAELARKL
jgi:uncharacterized membrane protein YqaE (UPF0057 family)